METFIRFWLYIFANHLVVHHMQNMYIDSLMHCFNYVYQHVLEIHIGF